MTVHPRVFWTADRSALVEEGDARAASLAYAAGDPIPDEHQAMLAPATAPATEPVKVTAPRGIAAPAKRARKPKA